MPVRLTEIYLPLDHEEADLRAAAEGALGLCGEDIANLKILRRAVDARRKPNIRFVYTLIVEFTDPGREATAVEGAAEGTARVEEPVEPVRLEPGSEPLDGPIFVVGAGPAGLFAALRLAEAGYRPVLLDRGRQVDRRRGDVRSFARDGALDPESNLVFGEGGAGTFSDGKLTHRSESGESRLVAETLASCGAPDEVRYDARPHVGSDVLPGVVAALRERVIAAGGEVRFSARVTSFEIAEGRVGSIEVETPDGRERVGAGAVLVAPGLSARDTWRALAEGGVPLEARSTLIGVRVEHGQDVIDRAQYGALAGHPRLGAAEYFLKAPASGDLRAVHSFCMCPGGWVIPVASRDGMLSTNGMSRRARDSGFANAALVAPVGPEDYGSGSPLGGVEFIERLEQGVFSAGGGDYSLPAQRLSDFLRGVPSLRLPRAAGGMRRRLAKVWELLPTPVVASIRAAVRGFAMQVRGFTGPSAGVYGAELRAGSPIKFPRGEDGASPSVRNLFPAGEGSGQSGGIVSSAVDGLRQAARVIARYSVPGG